jgi:hypothetical protein
MANWQLMLVIPIVLAAACYLFAVGWRAWQGGKRGCGGGTCGCPSNQAQQPDRLINISDIQLRRRGDSDTQNR